MASKKRPIRVNGLTRAYFTDDRTQFLLEFDADDGRKEALAISSENLVKLIDTVIQVQGRAAQVDPTNKRARGEMIWGYAHGVSGFSLGTGLPPGATMPYRIATFRFTAGGERTFAWSPELDLALQESLRNTPVDSEWKPPDIQ